MSSYKLLIGGELVAGHSSIQIVNPATGQPFQDAPVADAAQLDAAVEAAGAAFGKWSATPLDARKSMLEALAQRIEAQADELTELLVREGGKPLQMARGEVLRSAFRIRAALALPWDAQPRLRKDTAGERVYDQPLPLGVVAAIAPWNAPMLLMINKTAPALLTGNCVVVKPAPSTPLTTLKLGEIFRDVFPAGVVNVISDNNDLGQRLSAHPGVAKISFTGSTATGRRVMATAAGSLKRVQLELGGNDPALLLDDDNVDVEGFARKIFAGAMMHAGQICFAIKRAYVPARIHDRFCLELCRIAQATVVGDGMDPRTDMGPLQNTMQFERVKGLLRDASREGNVLCGGAALERPGYFIPPTIVADISESSRLVAEEQFGPVLPVLRYADVDEAVRAMNSNPYGLGATVWSSDAERAAKVAAQVVAGSVWVNQHMVVDHDVAFGGFRQSGFGVENGVEGLDEFLRHRVLAIRLRG